MLYWNTLLVSTKCWQGWSPQGPLSHPFEKYWLCNHRIDSRNGVLYIINQTTKITVSNDKNLKADSPTQTCCLKRTNSNLWRILQLALSMEKPKQFGQVNTIYIGKPRTLKLWQYRSVTTHCQLCTHSQDRESAQSISLTRITIYINEAGGNLTKKAAMLKGRGHRRF